MILLSHCNRITLRGWCCTVIIEGVLHYELSCRYDARFGQMHVRCLRQQTKYVREPGCVGRTACDLHVSVKWSRCTVDPVELLGPACIFCDQLKESNMREY